MQKLVIVNADDFGYSPGVNRGILRAHQRGIVTSTSVMVRWPAAAEAAAVARDYPGLSLGLHVDVGEWAYRDGGWVALYMVLPEAAAAPAGEGPGPPPEVSVVKAEVARQLVAFRRLTGRDPTHLDSHQHAHRSEPLRSVMTEVAAAVGVPLRDFDARVRYCGSFYGQAGRGEPYGEGITVEALIRLLSDVGEGVTEVGCHPGIGVDHESPYAAEREVEVGVLCDPRVREAAAAAGVRFISFAAVEAHAASGRSAT